MARRWKNASTALLPLTLAMLLPGGCRFVCEGDLWTLEMGTHSQWALGANSIPQTDG